MRAALVRVGVDQAFGAWNAPVDPRSLGFVYVPIPDNVAFQPGLETPYSEINGAIIDFVRRTDCGVKPPALPANLAERNAHLDPDFATLTYGDNGQRRGKGIAEFEAGDVLVFYAGLRPCRPAPERLIYAIIGLYRIAEVVRLKHVPKERWPENAHTRRREHMPEDVIVRANPIGSGRLRHCIPIGEWRSGAYRVRTDLLEEWGGLSCRDGFIQRSAVPPMLRDASRFMKWFDRHNRELIAANNPEPQAAPDEESSSVIVVMLRRPRANDRRTDPLFEFGSFGLTGCHRTNLLADSGAAGARLAFAQGGGSGFRLVMLTPPVDVRVLSHRREAFWSPGEMPLRYETAPLLINNLGQSSVLGIVDEISDVQRSTWEARFASAFRSRKSPLPTHLAINIAAAWRTATQVDGARASLYWHALPRKPDVVDDDRVSTYKKLRLRAQGSVEDLD